MIAATGRWGWSQPAASRRHALLVEPVRGPARGEPGRTGLDPLIVGLDPDHLPHPAQHDVAGLPIDHQARSAAVIVRRLAATTPPLR